MKDFIVNVRETWVQPVKVQAQTKKEALEKVVEGEGEYLEESLEIQSHQRYRYMGCKRR